MTIEQIISILVQKYFIRQYEPDKLSIIAFYPDDIITIQQIFPELSLIQQTKQQFTIQFDCQYTQK